ncbi:hypothetical protein SCNU_08766 [Gordonia neofelifaecis NRRL B-59395]|uniref:Uncharacterized protein n=1 Tax=Gordonia neofelifaecis NRRL B-59395 TaxID=644548 RepID=F1YIM9_9ACTN|nr:hypothetical protein SCNU_08766 [Gordonia neofelifaecis NRRL B-59395]
MGQRHGTAYKVSGTGAGGGGGNGSLDGLGFGSLG